MLVPLKETSMDLDVRPILLCNSYLCADYAIDNLDFETHYALFEYRGRAETRAR